MAKGRWKRPKAGVCRVCGCVDEAACLGGCCWVDDRGRSTKGRTSLCSSCSGTKRDLAHALRWVAAVIRQPSADVHLAREIAVKAGTRAAARALE